ncbi:hypothetical protein E2C01_037003 [Portunus trituberculatus]|uniref:Uncharacterized protein n=1 Tax=Portunus trituberculatus TaxID=210409 RepID=A0A5B7FE75_PORTR|nr:hypothetical protein [Portunus trituberculatus]
MTEGNDIDLAERNSDGMEQQNDNEGVRIVSQGSEMKLPHSSIPFQPFLHYETVNMIKEAKREREDYTLLPSTTRFVDKNNLINTKE